jgi:arabinofuranosyltransferase
MDLKVKLALLVILVIFIAHAVSLNFTQDDAFISYRYVKNFVNGQGLVFNPGERVEGYTNFFWILLLSIFALLGLDIIVASKILGVMAGCMSLFLLLKISTLLLSDEIKRDAPSKGSSVAVPIQDTPQKRQSWLFALAPCVLLTSNSAFAYWSISGLETALFVMMVLLSVYFSLTDERLMIISSALSSLIRPEGLLVFAILIFHKFFFKKDGARVSLRYIAGFALLLLPFFIFKISYYGNLLPNPFYAKTGFSMEYVKTGMDYFWTFLRHYGLWGALYLIPIVLHKHWDINWKLILLLTCAYTIYIIIVGGDVLQGHRFFMPIAPLLYLLFVFGLSRLSFLIKKTPESKAIPIFLLVAFSLLTFLWPRSWLMKRRQAEQALCFKMAFCAQKLRQSFGTEFTLAVSTIGAISYFTEAKVIDMLGLTDPYIARNPETIPGIHSTWKEKKFNTQFLLSQEPDVIMFSTGLKPSAPAERALFLSSQFRGNYYPYYFPEGIALAVYKKKAVYFKENEYFPDARFVNLYNEALNFENRNNFQLSLSKLENALEIGPEDFAWAYEHMAICHLKMGNMKAAENYARKAIEIDDHCMLAHFILHKIYLEKGKTAAALKEKEKILRHNPQVMVMK